MCFLRVGQAVGQVQHVHFLICDPPQLLEGVFLKDEMARGASQRSLTRSCLEEKRADVGAGLTTEGDETEASKAMGPVPPTTG